MKKCIIPYGVKIFQTKVISITTKVFILFYLSTRYSLSADLQACGLLFVVHLAVNTHLQILN